MLEFSREIASVAIVLGILTASLLALRRFRAAHDAPAGTLRAVAKLRLSEHLVLHVVECAGEQCLVTEQKSGCSIVPLRAGALRQEREAC